MGATDDRDDATGVDTKTEAGAPNGGKARSETSYPYYGLAKAIEIVGAVRRAGGNEAPNAAVMQEMNVGKSADRQWAYGVPAAMQFGLIERVGRGGEGRLKLTEMATRIALPANTEEERAAKVAAVRKPELYARLLERFAGHPLPSKEGLKNILHRDYKIVESMAPIAADAFLESVRTADLIGSNSTLAAIGGAVTPTDGSAKQAPGDLAKDRVDAPASKTVMVPADFIVYRCKIRKGTVIELPLPPDLMMSDVERMYAFLKTQADDDEST